MNHAGSWAVWDPRRHAARRASRDFGRGATARSASRRREATPR